jgi:hypothetical protein
MSPFRMIKRTLQQSETKSERSAKRSIRSKRRLAPSAESESGVVSVSELLSQEPTRFLPSFLKSKQPRDEEVEEEVLNPRVVRIHNPENRHNPEFSRNRIKTTKYTILSFIPRNLFEQVFEPPTRPGVPVLTLCQFRRSSNFYFLVMTLIQLTPGSSLSRSRCTLLFFHSLRTVSPINPIATFFPLLLVLGASAVKEAFEDYVSFYAALLLIAPETPPIRRCCKLNTLPCSIAFERSIPCKTLGISVRWRCRQSEERQHAPFATLKVESNFAQENRFPRTCFF